MIYENVIYDKWFLDRFKEDEVHVLQKTKLGQLVKSLKGRRNKTKRINQNQLTAFPVIINQSERQFTTVNVIYNNYIYGCPTRLYNN